MTIISPGSISLTNSAPIASRAQLSDDRMYPSSILPRHRGLIPCGSRTPMSLFSVKITIAKEPLIACIASNIALSTPFLAPLAIRLAITSESMEV